MSEEIKSNMKKLFILLSLLFLFSNTVHAFNIVEPATVGLIQLPETSMNVITLHNISVSGYGFGTNSTPTVHNLQIPYRQDWNNVFFKIGYLPICPLQPNNTILSLYCESRHIQSWNYSENCEDDSYNYEYEWIGFDLTNRTPSIFQTDVLSTTLTCSFYVNESDDVPRVDFWVRLENTGNKIVEETRTVIVVEGVQIFTNGIEAFSGIIVIVLDLILTSLEIFVPLWTLVGVPLFVLTVAYLLAIRIKGILDGIKN